MRDIIVFRRKSDLLADSGKIVPCYGVCCDDHGTCLRYEAVNFSDAGFCMGHCPMKADGTRSMYVPDRRALLQEVRVPKERRAA
jgi:hypothetical protein